MRDLTKAIISLYPQSSWELNGDEYSGLVWKSDEIEKPTEQELNAECDRLQAEADANIYKEKRAKEYPSLADFADAYYWMQKGKTDLMDEYVAKCDAVKNKFPKETT